MTLQGDDCSDDQFDQLIEEATPFTRLKFAHFAIAGFFCWQFQGVAMVIQIMRSSQ